MDGIFAVCQQFSGKEFFPILIAFGFEWLFVFVPVLECVGAPEIIEEVEFAVQDFKCFRIDFYFLSRFSHGVSAPASVGGLIFFRRCFEFI